MTNERKEICCVCGCALPETSLYFTIAEHEKAICKRCVSEMCPTYLSERGICLEWKDITPRDRRLLHEAEVMESLG